MSENQIVIEAKLRSEFGKGYARKLRAQGKIPGNIIHQAKSTPIELDSKLLSKAWQADKTFVLDLGTDQKRVRIQELQLNSVKRTALHVDLMYA